MSNIKLVPVKEAEKVQFIKAIQVAFQKSYETTFGHQNALVLPSSDIEASFNTPGSRAYFAFLDGEIVGETVLGVRLDIVIPLGDRHGSLRVCVNVESFEKQGEKAIPL